MNSPATLSAAARFAIIIDGLGKAVAARIGHHPITGPVIVYIWKRLNGINQRFQALTALILAGKLPAGRTQPRRDDAGNTGAPKQPGPRTAAVSGPVPAWRLLAMNRFAWLCAMAPNDPGCASAAVYGDALRRLLDDPEMAALLAATPRMATLLRPLCWALGVRFFPPRARRKRVFAHAPTEVVDPPAGGVVSSIPRAKRRKPTRGARAFPTRVDDGAWTRFLALA